MLENSNGDFAQTKIENESITSQNKDLSQSQRLIKINSIINNISASYSLISSNLKNLNEYFKIYKSSFLENKNNNINYITNKENILSKKLKRDNSKNNVLSNDNNDIHLNKFPNVWNSDKKPKKSKKLAKFRYKLKKPSLNNNKKTKNLKKISKTKENTKNSNFSYNSSPKSEESKTLKGVGYGKIYSVNYISKNDVSMDDDMINLTEEDEEDDLSYSICNLSGKKKGFKLQIKYYDYSYIFGIYELYQKAYSDRIKIINMFASENKGGNYSADEIHAKLYPILKANYPLQTAKKLTNKLF